MSSSPPAKFDFVPIESIVAFAFIGVMILAGLVARCLASNQSTVRSTQSLDLMIYRPAPKPAQPPKHRRPSLDDKYNLSDEHRDQVAPPQDTIVPARIQRGPKNL